MRRLSLFAALLMPCLAGAQVTGTFFLDKTTFAPGEPVFLNFTLTNTGSEPQEVATADPYAFCSGYQVQVTHRGTPRGSCSQGWGGSCLGGAITLAPHASRTERLLLNYPELSPGDLNPTIKAIGEYTIDATRSIRFAPPGAGSPVFSQPNSLEVHQTFDLRVDNDLQAAPAVYQPFLAQLASSEFGVKEEAALTLASLAPPQLSSVLLSFATSKDTVIQQFAPLALFNLSTPESLQALADMLAHTKPGTYENARAAEFLGRTHDPKWFPLLLDYADRQGSDYLQYAAESGRDTAIPALLTRLASTDQNLRTSVIFALGASGSREAIPVLIGLLKTPLGPKTDEAAGSARLAGIMLQLLTHLSFDPIQPDQWTDNAWQRWHAWWLLAGQAAPVYAPHDCGPDAPLP